MMMMAARSRMHKGNNPAGDSALSSPGNAFGVSSSGCDLEKQSNVKTTASSAKGVSSGSSSGKGSRSSKKNKREKKRLEKLRRAQARKDAAAATALKKRQDRDQRRLHNSEKRAALGLDSTPESSPVLRAASAPANPVGMGSMMRLHGSDGLGRPASPPPGLLGPEGTITLGVSPPGSGGRKANGIDGGGVGSLLARSRSTKKKGRKKKGKKKRNSWQQARDDRLRNMAAEREQRDRLTSPAQSPPGSGSDSGASGVLSGTTSGSESDGSESGWGLGGGINNMIHMPVIAMSTLYQHRKNSRSDGSDGSKGRGGSKVSKGVASMVFAEMGSDVVVAFNVDSTKTKGGSRSVPVRVHHPRPPSSLASPSKASLRQSATNRTTNSFRNGKTGKKDLKAFAKDDKRLAQLQPVSLHRPRWIRGDQWQVQCATTALESYVVLGHSGEPGAAAITVWERRSGKQLHTMYGSRGAVRFVVPVEMPSPRAEGAGPEETAAAVASASAAAAKGPRPVTTILSGDAGGGVCLWDVNDGTLLCVLPSTGNSPVTSLAAERSFHHNETSPCVAIVGDESGTLRVWESTGKDSFCLRGTYLNAHVGIVTTTAMAQWQDPIRLVASGGEDWTVRIWETEELVKLAAAPDAAESTSEESAASSATTPPVSSALIGWTKVLRGHEAPITGLALDLIQVTSCSLDGTIKVWGTVGKHAGNCMRTLSHPFSGVRKVPVCSLAVGTLRIAAGFQDGSMMLYQFGRKNKLIKGASSGKVASSRGRTSAAWRKGGTSPQAKRHAKNTAKGANRKYVSGGNRRSMRDLQAKCKDPSMLLFDLE